MDSEEEDFISIGGDEEVCSEEESIHYSSGGNTTEKNYKILTEEDIRQLQENDISKVSTLLSVSRGAACALLYQKNWSLSAFYDEWISDDDDVISRRILGKRKSLNQVCNICFEEINNNANIISATACGHSFCVDCWKTYITTSINDGPGCLTLHCPEPDCEAAVGLDMVDKLISGDDRDKYYKYLNRSYVELNRKRKWCPSPGCDLAVEFDGGVYDNYDVTCGCCHRFCWKCTEESHRPVGCETVAKWAEKNLSEAENTKWILAYTKPCPKCKRPIEKNQGCNMMRCGSPCFFRFCWVCLESHGYHACNRYNAATAAGGGGDAESRMNARKHLERYSHYYERWHSNAKSRERVLVDLNRARNKQVLNGELQFVMRAWEQIAECRRVLKWSYAYGYYLSMEKNMTSKLNFFEYLQGEAEAALERLHHCAEKEMDEYLRMSKEGFGEFRKKLSDLTSVTRNYFENLVRALENNLSEVEISRVKTGKSVGKIKPL